MQGYLVGNGVTDSDFDDTLTSLVPFAHGMGLISDDIYEVFSYTTTLRSL